MPYIGTQPLTGQFKKLDAITVVNGQAAYTLNHNSAAYKPATANALLVSVNGVIQAAGDAFNISGSTITFTENLVTGDVIDFIIALGDTGSPVTPVDGSVTTAKLVNDAVTSDKLDTNIDIAGTLDVTGVLTADAGVTLPAGQGINFSATANTGGTGATMQNELFDDYETGTFTPVIGGSTVTGTTTYGTQLGRYTKIGNVVHLFGIVTWSGLNGTGNLVLYNIPFVTSETGLHYEGLAASGVLQSDFSLGTGYTQLCMYYPAYTSNNYLFFYATGSGKAWSHVGVQNTASLIWSFTYTTD